MKKINIKYITNYLLPKNNLLVGMGSVFNVAGNYFDYNYSKTGKQSDFTAIMSDWKNIGDDIRKSIENEKQREL